MTALRDQLHIGIATLNRGEYSHAVSSLEAFLKQVEPESKPYLQAQMHLVQAYQGNGQRTRACSLCCILATSHHSLVREWAQQTMKALVQENLIPPASLESTDGRPTAKTLPSQSQPQSLNSLSLQGTKAFLQRKKQLLESYLGKGQSDRAMSLCLTLAANNNPHVQRWAQRIIRKLSQPALPPATPASVSVLSQPLKPQPSSSDECAKPNRYFANYLEGTAMEKVVSQISRKNTVIL